MLESIGIGAFQIVREGFRAPQMMLKVESSSGNRSSQPGVIVDSVPDAQRLLSMHPIRDETYFLQKHAIDFNAITATYQYVILPTFHRNCVA